jgi:hypothetical protein
MADGVDVDLADEECDGRDEPRLSDVGAWRWSSHSHAAVASDPPLAATTTSTTPKHHGRIAKWACAAVWHGACLLPGGLRDQAALDSTRLTQAAHKTCFCLGRTDLALLTPGCVKGRTAARQGSLLAKRIHKTVTALYVRQRRQLDRKSDASLPLEYHQRQRHPHPATLTSSWRSTRSPTRTVCSIF